MPRSYESLSHQDAMRILSAAEAKAKAVSLGVPYSLAVVDAGGLLLAFLRQDWALIGSAVADAAVAAVGSSAP
jgi:uncharacterized protein GlcG (DUF336 family)